MMQKLLFSLFSAYIHNMEGKSSTQRGAFSYVYLSIVRAEWPENDSEFIIFLSPNYNKFAVECDWNSKVSQIRIKVVFF